MPRPDRTRWAPCPRRGPAHVTGRGPLGQRAPGLAVAERYSLLRRARLDLGSAQRGEETEVLPSPERHRDMEERIALLPAGRPGVDLGVFGRPSVGLGEHEGEPLALKEGDRVPAGVAGEPLTDGTTIDEFVTWD